MNKLMNNDSPYYGSNLHKFLTNNGFDSKSTHHEYSTPNLSLKIDVTDLYECTISAKADGKKYKNTFCTESPYLFEAHLYNLALTNNLGWKIV